MKYLGGKNRFAKEILDLIPRSRYFIEPFVGGGGMTKHAVLSGKFEHFLCSDINEYVIEYFKDLQKGWLPEDSYDIEKYNDIKKYYKKKDYSKYTKGEMAVVGYTCAYMCGFFRTYDNGKTTYRYPIISAEKDKDWVCSCKFYHSDYSNITLPDERSVIYCDPPYKDTESYRQGKFNHDKFYEWAREISKKHHVFVSEQSMPAGWKCIWSKEVKKAGDIRKGRIEKLFVLK